MSRRIPGARFLAGCLIFAAATGGAGALADADQLGQAYALSSPPEPFLGAHEFGQRIGHPSAAYAEARPTP